MNIISFFKKFSFSAILLLFIYSCSGKLPGADARKYPKDPAKRVAKNLEEGRGFKLNEGIKKGFGGSGGVFDFASSNELWRASLDTLDFMPLALANYSGGIIVTDWYSDGSSDNESVKISIRFLSNDIRSDALSVKVFYKNCSMQNNCKVTDRSNELANELTKKILTRAVVYESENKSKKKNPKYKNEALRTDQ